MDDIPAIVGMMRDFHSAESPPWPLSEVAAADIAAAVVKDGFAAVSASGMILGVALENPLSPGWLVAKEFLWWASDGSGAALGRAFRAWARKIGASEIQWSCPAKNLRVRNHYARRAVESEAVYSEYLTCV